MTDLRSAAQQALEALEDFRFAAGFDRPLAQDAIDTLREALAQQAEPEQEPVAYIHRQGNYWDTSERHLTDDEKARGWTEEPLYTSPPQRQPLTEEEILKAIGWERAEMYMKLTPNFPIEEARKETIKNARAIERAHGIKE